MIKFLKQKKKIRRDEDVNESDYSECDRCYGDEKQFCDICGCFICKLKDDRAHILLCDDCGYGYHTRCLKPSIDEIPSGKWYCDKCKSSGVRRVFKFYFIFYLKN